ncbi:hypothetical protein TrRE_jg3869, partial [Triparma retinervis]
MFLKDLTQLSLNFNRMETSLKAYENNDRSVANLARQLKDSEARVRALERRASNSRNANIDITPKAALTEKEKKQGGGLAGRPAPVEEEEDPKAQSQGGQSSPGGGGAGSTAMFAASIADKLTAVELKSIIGLTTKLRGRERELFRARAEREDLGVRLEGATSVKE